MNVICILFSHILEDEVSKVHIYDSISYLILLCIKAFITLVFVMGLAKSYLNTTNIKTQNFIKELGVNGFLYLISQPLVVLVVILTCKL